MAVIVEVVLAVLVVMVVAVVVALVLVMMVEVGDDNGGCDATAAGADNVEGV